ncbi:asparagine synthase (glutamine-hydrolyzing) [Streptomyces boluensis]|uniref:asparagine synthase (glutamine-hydrolyzing) n=1 Tax=Streptomyces boluensis TaxID=1775135 RepID=A0A964UJY2_9ACTN|nr:asparagine synthase (glutamine-hydrolyzing) [Streptomyces boluensis]NBE49966.1 asparagine synthase (glutamine-hydrolyzing) [Streptomyces boluensis]
MCRIHGYFNTTATPRELTEVAALQRHGGPDGTGYVTGPGWGIGNNRLALVDPEGGRQPYRFGDRVHAVFNGEIYNHDALRRRLAQKGHTFTDRCDGSIIPALYAEYGDAFVDELDGMYAIAVLDSRGARPRLLLATDHIGMKPLYYHWDAAARALYFASEIPALLGFPGLAARTRPQGLDAYLATKTPFGQQTMLSGVTVLPPATTLTCRPGQAPRIVTRAAPDPVPRLPDDRRAVGSRLRGTLRHEVGRLLTADAPVAVITSGGLDSSLVTALAAEHRPVHSFNIAYRGRWPFDERHHARSVAEHTGTVHHQVEIDPAELPVLIEQTVAHLGQPNADPITVSTHALFAAVRAAGFKAALTGDAADEVFGGYTRMRAAAEADADGRPWTAAYLDQLGVLPARLRHRLYTDAYRADAVATSPLPATALDALTQGPGSALERITEFELRHRLPAYHLRRVDHLTMAHSVEARLPFCQRGVLALGRALPDRLRIHGGQVKTSLYAAAAGLLPHGVLGRPKQPFTLPVSAMLTPGTPLWEYARDTLAPARLTARGELRPGVVNGLFTRQAQHPDDITAATLWALLVHGVWRDRIAAARPLGVAA